MSKTPISGVNPSGEKAMFPPGLSLLEETQTWARPFVIDDTEATNVRAQVRKLSETPEYVMAPTSSKMRLALKLAFIG